MQLFLRTKRICLTGLSIFGLLFLAIPFLPAYESRIWTDSAGMFKVEATLLRMENDKIVIKKADGKIQTIPLSKLSREDQDYVTKISEKDNPFAGGIDSEEDAASLSKTEEENDTGLFAASGKPVQLQQGSEGGGDAGTTWSNDPDATPVPTLTSAARNVTFFLGKESPGSSIRDAGLVIYTKEDALKVISAFNVDYFDPKRGTNKSILFLGDPQSGESTRWEFPQKLTVYDVSPDGSKAIIGVSDWDRRNAENKAKRAYLHVVGITGEKPESITAYEPFAEDVKSDERYDRNGEIKGGAWVDDHHIMIRSQRKLIVMNIETGKVVWKISEGTFQDVVFSPGKRYCLLPGYSGHTVLLNTQTGEPVGKLENITTMGAMNFGFSPDGRTIAMYSVSSGHLSLWNATTGEKQEPFYIGNVFFNVHWIDNRFLLVGDRLIDTQIRSCLWIYRGMPHLQIYAGRVWFTDAYGETRTLYSTILPHQKVLDIAQLPEEQLFSIRPGTEVALEIDNSIKEGRDEIQKKMETIFRENGFVLKPEAEITLILKAVKEKEETVNYNTGFPFSSILRGGGTEVKYRPVTLIAEFRQGDKVLWSVNKKQTPPNNISLDEIKKTSLQKVVDDAVAKFDYKSWFLELGIPKKIPNVDIIGFSIVTGTGIRDGK